ncbi:FKBP-type peptidyl-prolyl cis-trans isomerase [Dyadobacter chenwenxiniae]|uniref:Peptidyl-prolyl cis-trans isomerase n=1 Tax=Dyadobacter chenwenxiniae TaxID=2906456 RepID=A0A9X1TP97_9BACT|nr:FKBP-type peptidyl-prolyl cis-trans isomerase [Dyadobacter chenwenxiniae]MCF0065338.1 FKBP-type peptidyl-prolyl cis-trans isomerase [Dyadobacter chenwenxiniae]UON82249.1 FKBP-type peptidyl-prolyl cis-trans isomerase [Dyadobacter chenwenxiniae]
MKRINLSLIIVFALLIGLSGCMDKDNTDDTAKVKENEVAIENYLKTDSLGSKAIRDSSGLYYIIRKANPNGQLAKRGDAATIKYTGYLLDGTKVVSSTVDSKTTFTFPVEGYLFWGGIERGIFLMKTGEKATFFLPFYLASGNSDKVNIPAYSPIRLEVEFIQTRSEVQQIDEFIAKKGYTNVERTSDNLLIIRTNKVTGDTIKAGMAVSVKYVGRLLDDTKFDEGTSAFTTSSAGTIPGFDRALRKLRKTEKAIIVFPSSLGYGKSGRDKILPYAPLQFEIEVLPN